FGKSVEPSPLCVSSEISAASLKTQRKKEPQEVKHSHGQSSSDSDTRRTSDLSDLSSEELPLLVRTLFLFQLVDTPLTVRPSSGGLQIWNVLADPGSFVLLLLPSAHSCSAPVMQSDACLLSDWLQINYAAFTLRTQYMKYLYPYECEKRGLSSPAELQAAIDSNRREGRRQSYGSVIFSYSPAGTPGLLSSPKMQPHLSMLGAGSSRISQTPMEPMVVGCLPGRAALALLPGGHHAAAVTQAAALEQLRETLQAGEPPLKKMMTTAGEQQRMVEQTLQQNLIAVATQLPLKIKVNNDRQETALNLSTNGISSINMSIEINGVVYTENTCVVLFALLISSFFRIAPSESAGQSGELTYSSTGAKTSDSRFISTFNQESSASSSVLLLKKTSC
uniref:AT-rich interactive domain-containing protein 3 n=1 Tax=Oryzias latipes TaxID=8090 RepID=A0A3P9MAD6_ORYLA